LGTTTSPWWFFYGRNINATTLAGAGNRAVYSDSNGFLTNTASDQRLKNNIENIENCLEIINSLKPIKYNWIDTEKYGPQKEIGFIAQEVELYIPEIIGINSDEMKSLDYAKITSVLTGAIQEQQKQIYSLIKRIEELEK
jgi:hypothetical protein